MRTRTEVDAAVKELRTIANMLDATEHVADLTEIAGRAAFVADLLTVAAQAGSR